MDKVSQLYDQLDKCMRTIDRLRETIYWYAEPHGSGICISPCCIDNGTRARAALNFLGAKPGQNEPTIEGWDGNGSPVTEYVRKEGVEL